MGLERVLPEMSSPLGQLAHQNGQKVRVVAGGFDERFDHAIELGARTLMTRRNVHNAVTDGEIHLTQNGRIEGELALEVVVDHGLVDAGAPGQCDRRRRQQTRGRQTSPSGLEDPVAGGRATGSGHN